MGIDNLPGSEHLETWEMPRSVCFLFGQEGPGSPRRPAGSATGPSRSPSSAPPARSTPRPRPRSRCTPGSAGTPTSATPGAAEPRGRGASEASVSKAHAPLTFSGRSPGQAPDEAVACLPAGLAGRLPVAAVLAHQLLAAGPGGCGVAAGIGVGAPRGGVHRLDPEDVGLRAGDVDARLRSGTRAATRARPSRAAASRPAARPAGRRCARGRHTAPSARRARAGPGRA